MLSILFDGYMLHATCKYTPIGTDYYTDAGFITSPCAPNSSNGQTNEAERVP